MEEPSIFGSMMIRLRETCRYHTGYPKDLGPSRVIHFTSEVEFMELLKQGYPVAVAFTIRSNYTKHLDKVMEEAAAEFYPDVKFMRVECPKYPGFCIRRQKTEYSFIELFHTPNQYGETPLHMAVKNGCNEAAKLLLSRGAFVEAKANNGMTPLHLAVWYSLRAEDCSTVKTLLEHNADCSAKDNDGNTPISHLSSGPGSERLRVLLNSYLEEQRKRKAIEACSETKAKMEQLEHELSKIVGLNDLKLQLRKWARGMLLDERRRALGLKLGARRPPHMAFLGNPGTGKTMVARILGKLLHMVGILPTDKVTEVQRTDLVGEFVGHTGPKTRRVLKESEGGILFVDEAYRLIPMQKSDDKDYGIEALEEIMSIMDSGKIVVIFAGYREPMQRVIYSNEGFSRRVTKFFHFEDFSSRDLATITHLKMTDQTESSLLYGFRLHPSCTVEAIMALIEKETTEKQRQEMNGGLIGPMLVNARENLDLRLSFDCVDADELLTITMEDVRAGLQLLSQ